jgi:hypothetical protein
MTQLSFISEMPYPVPYSTVHGAHHARPPTTATKGRISRRIFPAFQKEFHLDPGFINIVLAYVSIDRKQGS